MERDGTDMIDKLIGILVSFFMTALVFRIVCLLVGITYSWRLATAVWLMVSLVRRKVA